MGKTSHVVLLPTPDPIPENPLKNEDLKSRRARVKALFDKLDPENKGYLTADGITISIYDIVRGSSPVKQSHDSLRVHSASIYATELVKVCDKTKDGRITFKEFDDFVSRKEQELWTLFQQIDISKDNAIQVSEIKESLKTTGISFSNDEIKSFVAHLDQDRDGVIDFHEFRDFLLLLPTTPTNLKSVFQYFQNVFEVDFNSDATPLPPQSLADSWHIQLKYFLAGGFAGAISRTATAPLDRIRVFLQTETSKPSLGKSRLSASQLIVNSAKRIYANGGTLSFWKGNGLNVVKIVPESALKFYVFEYSKAFLADIQGHGDKDKIGMGARFFAGGAAGLSSQFLIYPLEILKTQVMSQISHGAESTLNSENSNSLIMRTAKNMWKEGGIKTFYRGCIPSLIGIVPYAGIDLMVFETLKTTYVSFLKSKAIKNSVDPSPGVPALLLCGMISGSIGASVVYPLSLIRTSFFELILLERLQAQGTPSHPERYTGMIDVINKTLSREGFSGFFKGLTPSLMKVLPAVSISYAV
ncbi:hypothetical protein HK096_010199, partial [Nowakowskiella sp. JEL0078]